MTNHSRLYKLGNELISRTLVPLEKKDWSVSWPHYSPACAKVDFINKPWADPDLSDANFQPKWNQLDAKIDRRSKIGNYTIDKDGYPLNPMGRTGIKFRGILGRWGPNHAADPIVTRWKRDANKQVVINSVTKKPILQFVAILRSDVKEWAIPGGMVDPGEQVSATLKREFCEESLNLLQMSAEQQKAITKQLKTFFSESNGRSIYKGYVDDPRNTDNAWMETEAVNFHDESGEVLGKICLNAGDDAQSVQWVDIDRNLKLYANHLKFIEMTVHNKMSHW